MQGKAYYNMAIIYENQSKFDSMWFYANKGDRILDNRKSNSYLEVAAKRKASEEKLEKQMKKAEDENPQDNR